MHRTHTCGDLRVHDVGNSVTLAGWVQRIRNFGGMIFIDLRDRYGITQLVFNPEHNQFVTESAKELGREYVIASTGKVVERTSKNKNLPTGDIEILVDELKIFNPAKVPPFTIEDETDGGEDLRMKYRYLDLRRKPLQYHLIMRHQVARAVREYLDGQGFVDVETPHLIKTTPEGARDFVVPSRLNPGQFYALPQSPQTFKQLLMMSGFDRYYQIVRCFRDEDLRADRQPEFTQIDCEMAFVHREDVLNMFEGMVKYVFKKVKGIGLDEFPRMSYDEENFSASIENITLYPNPSADQLNIILPKWNAIFSMQIYDITGTEIYYHKVSDNNLTIDVSEMNDGIYFIKLVGEKNLFVKKIIKSHL